MQEYRKTQKVRKNLIDMKKQDEKMGIISDVIQY